MARKDRLVQVLRFAFLAVPAVFLLALLGVQVRQQLFRYRAQLLLNDMQSLWMHPGTFKELQGLQERWGAFGHYDGTCTAELCQYTITLSSPERPWSYGDSLSNFAGLAFILQGSKEVDIQSGIVVHENRMVLESMWFVISAPDKLEIHFPPRYTGGEIMEVRMRSASHLFESDMFGREGDLKRGYEIGRAQPGKNAWVHVTPQTNAADIKRLTDINLDCITRIRPCVDMDDLLPAAWSEFRRQQSLSDEAEAYATRCSVSPALFAREADNIALVEVQRLHAPGYPREDITQGASVRVLERLKGDAGHPVGSVANISFGGQNIYAGPDALSDQSRRLAVGDRVFLLYPRLTSGQSRDLIDTSSCSLIPYSDATLQSVREGVLMDTNGVDLRDISIPY